MQGRWWIVSPLAVLLASCAFTPQQVTLNPQVQVSPGGFGQGRSVPFTAVDERPSSAIGSRGVGGFGAEITSNQDVAAIIHGALSDGLRRQGFSPVPATGSDARALRVEIRNLEYKVTPGIFVGTLRTEAVLKGICMMGSGRPYERLYRGQHEESVFVVQFAGQNEEYINRSVSQAVNSLLQDSDLMKCLAR
jgi:uncharacterized lipoprotein